MRRRGYGSREPLLSSATRRVICGKTAAQAALGGAGVGRLSRHGYYSLGCLMKDEKHLWLLRQARLCLPYSRGLADAVFFLAAGWAAEGAILVRGLVGIEDGVWAVLMMGIVARGSCADAGGRAVIGAFGCEGLRSDRVRLRVG